MSSGNICKRNESELRALVDTTIPQFIPFLPSSLPVNGTQRTKEELLAKVDQQVMAVLASYAGAEFVKTIARGSAQVAAGTTIDTMASLYRTSPASMDQTLRAATDVGVKTATGTQYHSIITYLTSAMQPF